MTARPASTGWYADPDNPGGERYWDGSHWSAWSGTEGQIYPARSPSALVMWGVISCLLFPPAGILVGVILLTRGRTRAGLGIVALNTLALLIALALLA
jgi:hypothetical protein